MTASLYSFPALMFRNLMKGTVTLLTAKAYPPCSTRKAITTCSS